MNEIRANCYSTRLSWALVLTWFSPFVQDKNGGIWVGIRAGYLATTFALKEQYDYDSDIKEGRKCFI